jgi:hypothetical protein
MHCSKPRIGSLPEKAAQQSKAKGKAFRVHIDGELSADEFDALRDLGALIDQHME